ncbi:MAG: DUF4123 domain-containing protein [Cupriavidus necator]
MTESMPLYVLADGAQFPANVASLVAQAPECRNVYAGMPEERAESASLFLARVGEGQPAWMTELDRLDQQMPCISLILSDAGIDALAMHLQQFLIADLGDKMSALVRYFDPRNLAAFLNIFGPELAEKLTRPMYQWKCRGHSRKWNGINGGAEYTAVQDTPVAISLDQRQQDYLIAHCEPDQVLFNLIQGGVVTGEGLYAERFEDLLHRYRRVAAWGLTEPMCRLRYCEYSYRYGFDFDQHPEVRTALEARWREGGSFIESVDALPDHVWTELLHRRQRGAGHNGE